jgi:hypothetical protein
MQIFVVGHDKPVTMSTDVRLGKAALDQVEPPSVE